MMAVDMYEHTKREFARDTVENGRHAIRQKANYLRDKYHPEKTVDQVEQEIEAEIQRYESQQDDEQ